MVTEPRYYATLKENSKLGYDCSVYFITRVVFTSTVVVIPNILFGELWWSLLRQESKFADWQRVRIDSEVVRVILRHDIVEQVMVMACDTVVFTRHFGIGSRREGGQCSNSGSVQEGVKGLRVFGVTDLSYKLAFTAN
ncbi:DNA replication licensing factor Mcm6 [Artemisia annua]|uniref:DNA replication licensing factor Mcm6 n=1 Tax=Artemisia annua TaxID=35608 RepID=A0A2U1LC24_ARTAN|nr:DNA replication licensing factor Mcm6 [Artemisia annua]